MTTHTDFTTYVVQGEYRVSGDPQELLSTVLGSCVAVCLYDPALRIGGMNHFLLPLGQEEGSNRPVRYGLFAMEVLINALLKQGAKKQRLQSKLFGGAKISASLKDIGLSNATFAREFLATEGIACVAESLGGISARRIVFRPATGHVRQLVVPNASMEPQVRRPLPPAAKPEIELF